MIGVNKNIKWDSMIASDWQVIENGYAGAGNNGWGASWAWSSSVYYNTSTNPSYTTLANGGQEGWTFASLTDNEIQNIMTAQSNVALPNGTFPFLSKILVPTISTDATGNNVFLFNNTSICSTNYVSFRTYAQFKATYTENNGKLPVVTTSVPTGKTNITHLVFVRGQGGNASTGSMTIDPTQFAAFTVGLPGSGAEIIMSDTTIALGKTFLIGSTAETSFKVSFTTSIEVQ